MPSQIHSWILAAIQVNRRTPVSPRWSSHSLLHRAADMRQGGDCTMSFLRLQYPVCLPDYLQETQPIDSSLFYWKWRRNSCQLNQLL